MLPWVDCELRGSSASKKGEGEPLCVRVAVVGEEEYGEKNDLGSAAATSSESESAGVIVGGGG